MSNVDQAALAEETPATPSGEAGQPAQPKPTTVDAPPVEEASTQSYWPENWRDHISSGDEKARKMLDRYASPEALLKKIQHQEKVISSRRSAENVPLTEDSTLEEQTAWRERQGLPMSVEQYLENLDIDNRVIGEADAPYVGYFAEKMFNSNASQETVNEALKAYFAIQEDAEAQRQSIDDQFQVEQRDVLRDKYGTDMNRNLGMISTMFEQLGYGEDWERLFAGRDAQGNLLGNDARFLSFLVDLAPYVLGEEATIEQAGLPTGADMEGEIARLTDLAGRDDSEYWRGANAAKMQERLMNLLNAKERRAARANR